MFSQARGKRLWFELTRGSSYRGFQLSREPYMLKFTGLLVGESTKRMMSQTAPGCNRKCFSALFVTLV